VSGPGVPATVASLDFALVGEVLARNGCNVTEAAAALAVPSSDLRRLLWANPELQDAAFEVVEARLDLAERNIADSLRSDDGRERLAASMFTIRNSGRSRRRGWITSAAAVDLTVAPTTPREIVISWQDPNFPSPEMETIWRDGKEIQVPRHGVTQSDDRGGVDALEGALATPPTMIEHAAAIFPGPEPELIASSSAESAPAAPDPAIRREREMIEAWIRNRLVDYPLAACLRCRRPFVAGAAWEEVSNGEARSRFHRDCHAEWRAEWEAAARQALGLTG
jgi:hypothetical protein